MSEVLAKVQLGFVTLVTVAFLVVTMPSTAHANDLCAPVTEDPGPADPYHLINPYAPIVDHAHDRRAIA